MEQRSWWDLDYEELQIGKILGEGSFGIVYKARWREQDVAIKQLKGMGLNSAKELELFRREADLMVGLKPHPNVVTLCGVCLNPKKPLAIVTEFLEMGSLKDLMKRVPKFNYLQVTALSKDICRGMRHLHMEKIIHRDLSCRNILVTEGKKGWTAKVADFGLSRVLVGMDHGQTESNTGPLKWMAPEALLYKTYSERSDSWAFGCTIIEMLSEGQDPYPELTPVMAASAVMHKNNSPSINEDSPPILAELLENCFQRGPEKRPDFKQILMFLDAIEKDVKNNPFY